MEFSTSSNIVTASGGSSLHYIGDTKPSPATESSSCTFHHRQGHSPTETPTQFSPQSSLLRLICSSTLLQHHLLVPFVHLLLNFLQAYSISITQNFIIVGPKSLLQLSTIPNKAQGFNIIRHTPKSLSTQRTSISRHQPLQETQFPYQEPRLHVSPHSLHCLMPTLGV